MKKNPLPTEWATYHKIKKELLIPKSDAQESNEFYGKKIVVTGVFEKMPREKIEELLWQYGADINSVISKKTDIVIIGKTPGPSKMKKLDELNGSGCNIRIIDEDTIVNLL